MSAFPRLKVAVWLAFLAFPFIFIGCMHGSPRVSKGLAKGRSSDGLLSLSETGQKLSVCNSHYIAEIDRSNGELITVYDRRPNGEGGGIALSRDRLRIKTDWMTQTEFLSEASLISLNINESYDFYLRVTTKLAIENSSKTLYVDRTYEFTRSRNIYEQVGFHVDGTIMIEKLDWLIEPERDGVYATTTSDDLYIKRPHYPLEPDDLSLWGKKFRTLFARPAPFGRRIIQGGHFVNEGSAAEIEPGRILLVNSVISIGSPGDTIDMAQLAGSVFQFYPGFGLRAGAVTHGFGAGDFTFANWNNYVLADYLIPVINDGSIWEELRFDFLIRLTMFLRARMEQDRYWPKWPAWTSAEVDYPNGDIYTPHSRSFSPLAYTWALLTCRRGGDKLWMRDAVASAMPWEHIGDGKQVVGMAALDGKLFAATEDNKLWIRDAVASGVSWQHIGHANGVVGMAALDGKLFTATEDNRLWIRNAVASSAPWHHIGHANGIVGMAALNGKLFAASHDNRLWMRNAVASSVPWQHIGDAKEAVGMTALDGKLFAASQDNKLWMRDAVASDAPWQHIGHANGVVGMAALNGKLFAATQDNRWRHEAGDADVIYETLQNLDVHYTPTPGGEFAEFEDLDKDSSPYAKYLSYSAARKERNLHLKGGRSIINAHADALHFAWIMHGASALKNDAHGMTKWGELVCRYSRGTNALLKRVYPARCGGDGGTQLPGMLHYGRLKMNHSEEKELYSCFMPQYNEISWNGIAAGYLYTKKFRLEFVDAIERAYSHDYSTLDTACDCKDEIKPGAWDPNHYTFIGRLVRAFPPALSFVGNYLGMSRSIRSASIEEVLRFGEMEADYPAAARKKHDEDKFIIAEHGRYVIRSNALTGNDAKSEWTPGFWYETDDPGFRNRFKANVIFSVAPRPCVVPTEPAFTLATRYTAKCKKQWTISSEQVSDTSSVLRLMANSRVKRFSLTFPVRHLKYTVKYQVYDDYNNKWKQSFIVDSGEKVVTEPDVEEITLEVTSALPRKSLAEISIESRDYEPPVPISLAINPSSVQAGAKATGVVTLSGPAPSGGAVVLLHSEKPDIVSVPGGIDIPAEYRSGQFELETNEAACARKVNISARRITTAVGDSLQVLSQYSPPSKPTGFTLMPGKQGRVRLFWDSMADIEKFIIQRKRTDTGQIAKLEVEGGATSYYAPAQIPCIVYIYHLYAISHLCQSPLAGPINYRYDDGSCPY